MDFPVPVSPGVIILHIFSTKTWVKNIILWESTVGTEISENY